MILTPQHAKVTIVGAGAAGLECAHRLVTEFGFSPNDLIILEARERIGGRIHTATLKRTTAAAAAITTTTTTSLQEPTTLYARTEERPPQNTANDDEAIAIDFAHDYGAAWVHGTGYDWGVKLEGQENRAFPLPNPMMKLLQEATPPNQSVYDVHLKRTFCGNPWMRPKTVLHDDDKIALFVAGQRLNNDSPIVAKSLQRYFMILDEVSAWGNDLFGRGLGMETVNQSLAEAVAKVQSNERLEAQLLDASSNEKDRQLISTLMPFYFHLLECWYGNSTSNLQMCEFVEDDSVVYSESMDEKYEREGDFYGPHCKLRQGMVAVLDPLLRDGVNERIHLGQEVVKIQKTTNPENGAHENEAHDYDDHDSTRIIVQTASGLSIQSDVCVLTLPVGCLQHVAQPESDFFDPKLSDSKLDALSATRMGCYKKVFLTFDRIFWPQQESFIGLALDPSLSGSKCDRPLGNYLLIGNLWACDNLPCLEAVLFGTSGEWAKHKSEDTIAAAVLDFMVEAMGATDEIKSYLTHCEVTRWEEDPYSRGAYSSVALGASIRQLEGLKEPEWDGRLLFSGEATISEFEGSVHAALFSGRTAAKQARAFFHGKCSDASTDTESADSTS